MSTAVELRFDIGRSSLPEDVKARLRRLGGSCVTADDVLVIDSREHRTQAKNREEARRRLVAFVRQAARRPRTRKPTRPSAASREARIQEEKRRGAIKAERPRRTED